MPKSTPKPAPKKSDRRFVTILVIVGVIGVAALGYVLMGDKGSTSVVVDTTQPMPNARGKVIGSDSAPVEIVMFGDFECPGCGQFADLTEYDVRNNLVVPGLVRYRFADFPLVSIHPTAMAAHNAASCANAQGQFWPMHDRIYHLRHEWSAASNGRDMDAPKIFKRYARELKLDSDAFATCFDNNAHEAEILESVAAGTKLGVGGTPTIIVGKRMIIKDRGIPTYDDIKAYVDSALADVKSGR
jgi:protein-disulfide isomerase